MILNDRNATAYRPPELAV